MSYLKKAKSSNPIVIIGSGLAGYTLVREIRKGDPNIPIRLITADDGRYYSKPNLSTALTHNKTSVQLALFSAEKFAAQQNIEIITHTIITAINPDTKTCVTTQGEFNYSSLILACGAKPIQLPNTTSAYHVNNLADYQQFREAITNKKHIAIIGTGLVGCEFANDLINANYQVSMISPDQYPLARLLPKIAGDKLKEAFLEKGVNFYLEKSVTSTTQNQIHLDNNNIINVDIILSAVGLQPEIVLAKKSNIHTNKGIVVDQYLQTNQADIYALGDCAEVQGKLMPYVAPLSVGARALAKTLLNQPTEVIYPPMPIYIKTPAYPMVVLLPPDNLQGEWQIQTDKNAVKSLFYDHKNALSGFILTATATVEAAELIKQIAQ